MVAVPTMGLAVVGQFETAAWWNAQVKALGDFVLGVPLFSGYSSVSQSLAHNVLTNITFDTEDFDTAGGHSTVTNTDRYTCQVPGVYCLTGCVCFAPLNTTGLRMVEFRVNGSAAPAGGESILFPSATQGVTVVPKPTYVRLALGDYVTLSALQTSGNPLTVGGAGGATQSTFSCAFVSA